jgi:hypothetical protein
MPCGCANKNNIVPQNYSNRAPVIPSVHRPVPIRRTASKSIAKKENQSAPKNKPVTVEREKKIFKLKRPPAPKRVKLNGTF